MFVYFNLDEFACTCCGDDHDRRVRTARQLQEPFENPKVAQPAPNGDQRTVWRANLLSVNSDSNPCGQYKSAAQV